MGFEESCSKMQLGLGEAVWFMLGGVPMGQTSLGRVANANLSTTTSENAKPCLLSEFVALL